MILSTRMKRIVASLLVLLALGFLYAIHQVLAPFLVAGLLVYILNPMVARLSALPVGRFRLGRRGAVGLVIASFFSLLGVAGLVVVPGLHAEGIRITHEMPQILRQFESQVLAPLVTQVQGTFDAFGVPRNISHDLKAFLSSYTQSSGWEGSSVIKQGQAFVKGIFSTIFSVILVFMLTVFVLLDLPQMKSRAINLFPLAYRSHVISLGGELDRSLSGAIRGQLLVCLINGLLTTLGLLLLNIKFALTIGLIAGICSLIPIFGTVISTIPAVLIALNQGWLSVLQVVGLISLIHLIEANILNPKVLGHHSEVHPVLVLFALLVGEHYAGAIGLLVAVPITAMIVTVLRFTYGYLVPPTLEMDAQAAKSETVSELSQGAL